MTMDRAHRVSLLYLIKQVERAVKMELDRVVSEGAGLTVAQYTALTVLERQPGMTSAALARSSFVRAQTMAELVTSLLDRGLIVRERDPDNRRQLRLALSDEGREVVKDLREPVAVIEDRLVDDLDEAEAEALRGSLTRCRRALDGQPVR